jgi:hypothetical protein
VSDCQHVNLKLLEGPLDKDKGVYRCVACGKQFVALAFQVGVSIGPPKAEK